MTLGKCVVCDKSIQIEYHMNEKGIIEAGHQACCSLDCAVSEVVKA